MNLIPLTKGKFAKVDDDDFEKFSHLKWHANEKYARRNERVGRHKLRMTYLHRIIMGDPKGQVIDHVNRDTLDCRKSNLRICTSGQNSANTAVRKNSKSGIRGVFWHKKSNKWHVTIGFEGKTIYGGIFNNKDDAAKKSLEMRKKYFGEFSGTL